MPVYGQPQLQSMPQLSCVPHDMLVPPWSAVVRLIITGITTSGYRVQGTGYRERVTVPCILYPVPLNVDRRTFGRSVLGLAQRLIERRVGVDGAHERLGGGLVRERQPTFGDQLSGVRA